MPPKKVKSDKKKSGEKKSGDKKTGIVKKVENIVKKTYYPSDTGKSIFKTQDLDSWKLVESRDHHSKFVFEITETDLQ
jgi:hypothetical protein